MTLFGSSVSSGDLYALIVKWAWTNFFLWHGLTPIWNFKVLLAFFNCLPSVQCETGIEQIYLFIAIFLDNHVQGKRRKEVSWNPCKAPTLSGQTTITGRIPFSFRTVMWVLQRPLLNHEREDAGDGTNLSEKTRKSNLT